MEISENLKVNTPIVDFIGNYCETGNSRFHMPGHKGHNRLGFEQFDLTEIDGADDLYHPNGIIAESENNASQIFDTRTYYSTEGSSQCIKAMLKIAMDNQKDANRTYVLAARNVHKSFIYGVALLDLDVRFINSKASSICSNVVESSELDKILKEADKLPIAVYITSPDYLGIMSDIKTLSDICHKYDVPLIVDNAHGAYLHFLKESLHPMDLGADMCCDSAHKTLPVITGGAYLHIGGMFKDVKEEIVKESLGLFGSTSPSYLILASLDKCNEYLAGDYRSELRQTVEKIDAIKDKYKDILLANTDPLKITIKAKGKFTCEEILKLIREEKIEVEYSDKEYIVLMVSTDNTDKDFERLGKVLATISKVAETADLIKQDYLPAFNDIQMKLSIRQAIMCPHEIIETKEALGRICASPSVSCPPAIPIAISGQIITEHEIRLFEKYEIDKIEVCKENK